MHIHYSSQVQRLISVPTLTWTFAFCHTVDKLGVQLGLHDAFLSLLSHLFVALPKLWMGTREEDVIIIVPKFWLNGYTRDLIKLWRVGSCWWIVNASLVCFTHLMRLFCFFFLGLINSTTDGITGDFRGANPRPDRGHVGGRINVRIVGFVPVTCGELVL